MVALDTVTIALSRVLEAGLVPVLAHPERYTLLQPRGGVAGGASSAR